MTPRARRNDRPLSSWLPWASFDRCSHLGTNELRVGWRTWAVVVVWSAWRQS